MIRRMLPLVNGDRTPEPRNRLLATLPGEVLSSLRPHLKPVSMPCGRVLSEADEPLRRVYFIEAGAVSLVTVFEDGGTAEMATVGCEGMVGLGILLGGDTALGRHVVPVPGLALAIDAGRFQSALRASPELRRACEAYAQAFFAHLLQNVACNAAHKVEQRCARWLLMCGDQTENDAFELTQEGLAEMLGVRRSTVTVVAGALQEAGLIHYRRGAITVLDRRGLEAAACECYRIVRSGYERPLARAPSERPGSDPVAGSAQRGPSTPSDARSNRSPASLATNRNQRLAAHPADRARVGRASPSYAPPADSTSPKNPVDGGVQVVRQNWARAGIEPSLGEVIDDPIVHLVMRRDGVSRTELLRTVEQARAKLRPHDTGAVARRPETVGPSGG